jgi:hypothetical protein
MSSLPIVLISLLFAPFVTPTQWSPIFAPEVPWSTGQHTSPPPPGLGSCTASKAFFTRAASNIAAAPTGFSPPITTWESAVDSLICGQVTAGTWNSKDFEYFEAAPSLALAEMNLVSSSYTLIPNGNVIFDNNVGVSTDHAVTSYFDTGYDPSVNSKMTSSSGYLGICQINTAAGGFAIGEFDASLTTGMYVGPTSAGTAFFITQMQGTGQSKVNNLGSLGGFAVSRTDNAHIQSYFNGLPVGTLTSSTGGIVGGTSLFILAAHRAGTTATTSQATLSLAAGGGGETAAQISADHVLFSAALATMLIQSGC